VSWDDAVAYASWAGMSLPTEAQWEYAARAGTTTRYWSGDSESDLARVDWVKRNFPDCREPNGRRCSTAHAVGKKPANPWGLYDVHGNVMEYTADWLGVYPASSQTDPAGPGSGDDRVVRGGFFDAGAYWGRSAHRFSQLGRNYHLGFRVSKKIP